MARSLLSLRVLAPCLLCIFATAALGQTAPPPPPDVEPEPAPLSTRPDSDDAAVHLQNGLRLYQAQEYLKAAAELKLAYAREPQALLLFNIAQAYRKALRPREAMEQYQLFLQADPGTALRGETEAYINDMKALLSEQQKAERAEREAQARLQEQGNLAAAKERADRALRTERERAERERKRPLYKRGWFWGVMAATAVAIGAGIGLAVAFTPRDPQTDGGFVGVSF